MLTEGVWAEISVGTERLRFFSEHNAQCVQASVYNVNTTVSTDGKTMTVTAKGANAAGKNVDCTNVMVKQ